METKTSTPPTPVYLKDYRPPDFEIAETEMELWLDADETRVRTRHRIRRLTNTAEALRLDGEGLLLDVIELNGLSLKPDAYMYDGESLTVQDVPDAFALLLENRIQPRKNTSLSGLYYSSGMLCTQCEAEGFRRITFSLDRPDALTRYSVTLYGDRVCYPVLLCNGNQVARGVLGDGQHWIRWDDPFPKPSYLFAIVAGDLACLEERFTTVSGNQVQLRFFAAPRDIEKCRYALGALQRAMRWDEETYGREYDLDLYNVVAVADFNMGAMENKSLNIFNIKYVLAQPEIATDADYRNIEGVIGHEYFHNWSGNRVTCRDWFQLSLKEGFTVFRDQEFSADMGAREIKRIEEVNLLRNHQFREDAGPMAHPVRPDSYIEINNFYTATVYNKGAEVVRMLRTLLGAEKFRAGTDLYFERHDGQAVTTDHFVAAMEAVSGRYLSQFKRWYSQAGTPRVEVTQLFEPTTGILTLVLRQHCPPTPGQNEKQPFLIPVRAALLDHNGRRLPLILDGEKPSTHLTETVLELQEREQVFQFHGLTSEPVPSLLRGFSAPVILEQDLDADQLALLLTHDSDAFNRWEAGQQLALRHLLELVVANREGREIPLDPVLEAAFGALLKSNNDDGAFLARILELPAESYIGAAMEVVRPIAIHQARSGLRRSLGLALRAPLKQRYREMATVDGNTLDWPSIAARSLRDACLGYLVAIDDDAGWRLAEQQLKAATCMTDTMTAITALAHSGAPNRQSVLDEFYRRWQEEALVVDKWLRLQATAPDQQTLARVEALTRHPAFDPQNPNKVYALIGAFCLGNAGQFHRVDGAGYRFLTEWVLRLDPLNPQVASRLVSALSDWRRYGQRRQRQMQRHLQQIAAHPGLSKDVGEIVAKSLQEPAADAGSDTDKSSGQTALRNS